ncbi:hypothetical protein ACFTAO_30585 [Paenibacillus rhizoplanae]
MSAMNSDLFRLLSGFEAAVGVSLNEAFFSTQSVTSPCAQWPVMPVNEGAEAPRAVPSGVNSVVAIMSVERRSLPGLWFNVTPPDSLYWLNEIIVTHIIKKINLNKFSFFEKFNFFQKYKPNTGQLI